MTENHRCKECGGEGWKFVLRRGNPFAMRIEVLAQAMEKVRCYECHGTGNRSFNPKTTDDY